MSQGNLSPGGRAAADDATQSGPVKCGQSVAPRSTETARLRNAVREIEALVAEKAGELSALCSGAQARLAFDIYAMLDVRTMLGFVREELLELRERIETTAADCGCADEARQPAFRDEIARRELWRQWVELRATQSPTQGHESAGAV